ncbi:DUF1254 domain-containing protein [Variovorax rhizosphaerae]|uniref:DUF1254 domain-containing protein n=1 Tax=Variovorax rhizosphaerae TaxID=1836200 RepID=A0ABU8WLZ1_9BURK
MDGDATRRGLCLAMTLGALGTSGFARAADSLMLNLKDEVEDSVDSLKGDLKARQARDLAIEAYIYAYPLVTMELTRRSLTNVAAPEAAKAPMGQFLKLRGYPAVDNHAVTAPNADTLYTILWLDVAKEPWVVSTPDMKGRFFLLPMLDGWTDVFEVPAKRTTGTGPQKFAITGPGWKGTLPAGVKQYKSPTGMVWMLGRIYCTGTPEDYAEVHALQDQMSAVPLSSYGKSYTPPPATVDPSIDSKTAVRDQVEAMDAASYFTLFAQLLKTNPPAAADAPMVAKLAKIGIVPGKDFDASRLDASVSKGLAEAPKPAQAKIMGWMKKGILSGDLKLKNGWTYTTKTGLYGTNYMQRALITAIGLGANRPQDAVYPTSTGPDILKKYDGSKKYVMHFPKGQLPPVNGFWSLTMYDTAYFFVPNALNRYTVSQRNKLKTNADGSVDLYIQNESPGADKEENWLPAPKDGFILMMRLYWPKDKAPSLLDGSWFPPRAKEVA